jgi:hypothetical protein
MLATKLACSRINACFEFTQCGLFLTCRGNKYEQHKQHIYSMYNSRQYMCIGVNEKKISYFG